jgi:hypothetical protein
MGKWMAKIGGCGVFWLFIAEAFGIPFDVQGKPLTTVQLVCFFGSSYIKALSSRHWPSTAEAWAKGCESRWVTRPIAHPLLWLMLSHIVSLLWVADSNGFLIGPMQPSRHRLLVPCRGRSSTP